MSCRYACLCSAPTGSVTTPIRIEVHINVGILIGIVVGQTAEVVRHENSLACASASYKHDLNLILDKFVHEVVQAHGVGGGTTMKPRRICGAREGRHLISPRIIHQ